MDLQGVYHRSTFNLSISGADCEIAVQRFTAEEAVSECYAVKLWLVSEIKLNPKDVMHKEACITISGDHTERFFHGVLNKFSVIGRRGRFFLYLGNIVPRFWFLSLNSTFRIFQEKTVVEIAEEVLKERVPRQEYEKRLIRNYEKRRYCTQFGESDWHFLSRLFEEEGIFYYFDHRIDNHVLIIADDKIAHAPILGGRAIHYCEKGAVFAETISTFVVSREVRSGKISYTNYNFKRPSLDLSVQYQASNDEEHELYDYPGNYVIPHRGERLARNRWEEMKALEEIAEGSSNCRRLAPGYLFTLTSHDFDEFNRDYLLVKMTHAGEQSQVLGEQADYAPDSTYSNCFIAVPSELTIRPERLLRKPHAHGLQSATVSGPPGEEIYADEYGRVKVQFHWDREGQRNEKSSCWLRVSQPWSGQSWGMISLPRVGDEVLVDFINGDPDWPIVVGSVNNAQSPALYPLPANKTQSGIRTKSYLGGRDNFHELRFEDKKGSEEIYLQSERDWNILVKNDKAQSVVRDETLRVGKNRLKTVGVDQMEQVGGSHTETIGANKCVSVGANKTETVSINSAETIGLAKELTVGGLYQVSVAGAMNETVLGAKCEEVGITKEVLVASHMAERVAGNRSLTVGEGFSATVKETATLKARTIVLDADEEIVLKSGGATISLKSNGEIVVNGAAVTQRASGEIVIKGARASVN